MMRPEPEIVFEIRRPLVEARIALRHAWREFREGIAFVRETYRRPDISEAERQMIRLALIDGKTGGDTLTCDGNAHVQRRGIHFHGTVQA